MTARRTDVARVAHALAAAMLAGPLEVDTLLENAAQLFGRRSGWLRKSAERICAAFGATTRPRRKALAEFLLNDAGFVRACERREPDLRDHLVGRPTMSPVPAARDWELPALETEGRLADWLQLDLGRLEWLADRRGIEARTKSESLRNYRYRVLRGRNGKLRLIEVPKPDLKRIQRRILSEILDRVPTHDAAHGFRRGRSIRSFAAPHVGRRVVLRLDLQDFFPSISVARIQATFRTLGYPETVADLLAGFCTNVTPHDAWPSPARALGFEPAFAALRYARQLHARPHLPQGAPTSPALANLVAYRLDTRLMALAATVGATYTRFADDLAFSGAGDFARVAKRFALHAAVVAAEEGFAVNHRKTRLMRSGARQHLAGLTINRRLNVAREDFDRLKAVLTNAARHGLAGQNREGRNDFRAHLLGRITFVESIHPARGAKLRALYDRIP